MQIRPSAFERRDPDPLILVASTWLASGMVYYGFAPVPLHDATFGWTAAFWLLAAPVLVLAIRWAFARRTRLALATRTDRHARRRDPAVRWRRGAVRRRNAPARRGPAGFAEPGPAGKRAHGVR